MYKENILRVDRPLIKEDGHLMRSRAFMKDLYSIYATSFALVCGKNVIHNRQKGRFVATATRTRNNGGRACPAADGAKLFII